MSFDSLEDRQYPPLTVLPGGLSGLSRASKKRDRVVAKSEEPAVVAETRRWFDFLGIPQILRTPIIVVVVVIALGGIVYLGWSPIRPMFAWTYHQIPFVAKINRLDKEFNDPGAGFSAIANHIDKSQKQLANVTAFLVAKFPEFSSLILRDAENAIQNGDTSQATALLESLAHAYGGSSVNIVHSEDFFQNALQSLNVIDASATNNPQLAESSFQARVALAVYSSRLRPLQLPPELAQKKEWHNTKSICVTCNRGFDFSGHRIKWIGGPFAGDFFIQKPSASFDLMTNLALSDGSQTLDGFAWKDVVFENCDIKWNGGITSLQNVQFVNCRFYFSENPPRPLSPARKLLDYAVLGKGTLKLG